MLGAANFQVGLDSTPLEQGLEKIKGLVEGQTETIQQQLGQQEDTFKQAHAGIRESLEQSGVSLEGFRHGLEDITQIALGFTVANTFGGAFRQIGEAMADASEASRNLGEEITKLEAITGASAEAASTTIAVWARFGITAGDAERSFTTLSRAITAFNSASATGAGGAAGSKVLDDLGISLKTVEGNALPLTTVLGEVFDALNKVTDPATRDYDATTLLGRSWQDTARLIKEGSAGMEELAAGMGTANAETDAQVAANEKWSLSITGMQQSIHGLTLGLGDILSGPMTRLADDVTNMVKGWTDNKDGVDGFKSGLDLLVGAIETAGGALKDLIAIPIGAFLQDATAVTRAGTSADSLAVQSARVTGGTRAAITGYTPSPAGPNLYGTTPGPGSQAVAPPAFGAPPVDTPGVFNLGQAQRRVGPGQALDIQGLDSSAGLTDPSALRAYALGQASQTNVPLQQPIGGLPRPAPVNNYGARTAGQPGFTYVPPVPAVSEVAPVLPIAPTPPIAPVPEQIQATADFTSALDAGGGSAPDKKKALADYLAAQKDADEKQKKENDDYSKEIIAQDTATSKFQIGLLDDKLAAAKYAYSEETDANDKSHKSAIDGINAEKVASDAYYKGSIQAAQDKRDLESRSAGTTHDDALAQIALDKKTADDAFAAQKAGYDADKNAAQTANTEKHDKAIKDITDTEQQTRDARQVTALKLQEDDLAQDQRNAQIHEKNLDAIKSEGQAKLDAIAASEKADQDAAAKSLRVISDATAEYNAQHQSRLRALQDEAQAETAQHQSRLDAITAEQKRATDAHTADLKAITDQGNLLDAQHAAALQAISDQAAAEADAQHQYLEALQEATKAQTDLLDASTKSQVDAIDAQINAIQAAAAASQAAAQDTAQQSTLSTAQANLSHDATPGAGGDPASIIADAQAVDAAQAAIEATAKQRADAAAKDALDTQKKSIEDQAAAQKQAIQDQSAAQQKAIADQAYADNQARTAEIRNLNDELAQAKSALTAETAADNTAFAARMVQIQAEQDAENKRFQQQQVALVNETEAENANAQAFAASQAKKSQAVNDTLKIQTDDNKKATDDENKNIAASVKGEDDRYKLEQDTITSTRKLAADKLTLQQTHEDETFTAATAAANLSYKNEQDRIAETYDKPITGLYAQLATAEKTSHDTLDNRTKDANAAYKAEQDRIKQTYDGPRDDGGLALLPSIHAAQDQANAAFADRTLKSNAAYDTEKDRIKNVYQNIDPNNLGIIPAIEKAKADNQTALAQEILDWQNWATESNKTIQSVIDKLGDLHKAQSNASSQPKATAAASGGGAGGGGAAPSGGGAGGEGRGRYGEESISRAQWGSGLEALYGVDTRDAACGPLALEGLLSVAGQNPDLSRILAEAKAKGWWSTADGMEGADAFAAMAEAFGMPLQGVTLASALTDLERGVPIVLNTPHHYFLAQGYDPATGLFDMGNTGQSVFNKRYMTLAEAQAFGGGAVRDFFEPLDTAAVAGTPSRPASGDGILWDGVSTSGVGTVPATPLGTYASPSPANSPPTDVEAYIRSAALLRHIDPNVAVQVAESEGGLDTDRRGTFSTGSSWWPFQLHYGGLGTPYEYLGTSAGLGNDFTKQTGYAPGDARAWEASIDYALDKAVSGSWSQWYGAAAAGIGNWQGLPGFANGGIIDRPTLLVDAASLQPYAQAGERGIEHVVPPGGSVPGAARGGTYHFTVTGPAMSQVSTQIRREFERSQWLHQGWR